MTPVTFSIEKTRFDENYRPLGNTRLTTNFANLARGENRQQNLRSALKMIDDRFNELARQDNEDGDRYSVELDIVSVNADLDGGGGRAPLDRKSTRLNSSHVAISYAVFCLKKKRK